MEHPDQSRRHESARGIVWLNLSNRLISLRWLALARVRSTTIITAHGRRAATPECKKRTGAIPNRRRLDARDVRILSGRCQGTRESVPISGAPVQYGASLMTSIVQGA